MPDQRLLALRIAVEHGGFNDAAETEDVSRWVLSEIERLTEALRIARWDADVPIRELREENERLRKALSEIVGSQAYCPAPTERPTPWDIARDALGPDEANSLSGVPLQAGEQFPPNPSRDPDCRMCNWPWDDGEYCRRCEAVIRQEDEDA